MERSEKTTTTHCNWNQCEEGAVEEVKGAEEDHDEEEKEKEGSSVVGVSLCDSTPLVFGAADLKVVRGLGVVGTLVGSLPRQPRQNGRLGRPLLLQHQEARLLGEMGRAVALPTGHQGGEEEEVKRRRSVEQYEEEEVKRRRAVEQYEEQQERSYEEQSILALEDRKKALLTALKDRQQGEGSGSQQSVEERLRSLEQSFKFDRSAMSVQLNTARAGLDYWPDDRDYLKMCWPASDRMSETRYQVFRDLRGRGFFLTSAGKFGGDFLVYPGDPLRFHAHFIAVCLLLDESQSLFDILSVARLGSNVKKTVLLCSPGPEDVDRKGRVLYTSLQWSGMV